MKSEALWHILLAPKKPHIYLSSSKSEKVEVLKTFILNRLNGVHQSKHPKNTPFKALVEHYHLEMSDSRSFK